MGVPAIVNRAATQFATRAVTRIPMGMVKPTPSPGPGGPKAATGAVQWSSPGQPQFDRWNANNAFDVAYYGSIYVMRCVRTIADTIAGLPFRAGLDPTQPQNFDPAARLSQLLGPASPQAPGGPNKTMSSRALWAWSIVQYLVTGKMAWEMPLDPVAKSILALYPLVSGYVQPIPTAPGSPEWFSSYVYNLPDGVVPLKKENVFYAWRMSGRDPRQPESALEAASAPISIALGVDKYQWSLLKNNMVATTLVISPPFEESGMRRSWQDQFVSTFTGFDNAGKTIFGEMDSDPGSKVSPVQVERIAQTAEDAGLANLSETAKAEICIALGVPKSLIGDASERIYANADSEYRNFWTLTVLNIIRELEDHINVNLAPLLGQQVGWFDLSKVVALQAPSAFMPPALTDAVAAGIVSVPQAQNILGVGQSTDVDTSNAPVGEEAIQSGAMGGRAIAPPSEVRGILDVVSRVKERRTAQTPEASSVWHKVGHTDQGLWKDKARKLPAYIANVALAMEKAGHPESEAVEMAVGIVKGWAAGHASHGKVHPDVQAAAAKALAEWEADKASTKHGARSVVTEASSAGDLLPVGQPIPPKPREASLIGPHRFKGTDLTKCTECGLPIHAAVHRDKGKRHAGPMGHQHVPSGHVAGNHGRKRTVVKAQHVAALNAVEPAIEQSMADVFTAAKHATLARLSGKRGRQMLRKLELRASNEDAPNVSGVPSSGNGPEAPASAPVDAGQIYDISYWADRTAAALAPHYRLFATGAQQTVSDQVGVEPGTDSMAQAAVDQALHDRANTVAATISQTTYHQIADTLSQGIQAGEPMPKLADRVSHVFDEATSARAAMIARTESNGASNLAQATYAGNLPSGVIGGKEWLSVHDERTRETHRLADGQRQPMTMPFHVGASLMMHPGDVSAPPDETVNCRCTLAYLSASKASSVWGASNLKLAS